MTGEELTKRVAAEFGKDIDDATAGAILWSETSFPCYPCDDSEEQIVAHLAKQLREFFASGLQIGEAMDRDIERLRAEGKWPEP